MDSDSYGDQSVEKNYGELIVEKTHSFGAGGALIFIGIAMVICVLPLVALALDGRVPIDAMAQIPTEVQFALYIGFAVIGLFVSVYGAIIYSKRRVVCRFYEHGVEYGTSSNCDFIHYKELQSIVVETVTMSTTRNAIQGAKLVASLASGNGVGVGSAIGGMQPTCAVTFTPVDQERISVLGLEVEQGEEIGEWASKLRNEDVVVRTVR
jgi:hypothetical protein